MRQIPQRCNYYETSEVTGTATAYCFEPATQIASGAIGEVLTPVVGLEQLGTNKLDLPHLTPEGNELIVRNWQSNTLVSRILVYTLANGAATHTREITLAGGHVRLVRQVRTAFCGTYTPLVPAESTVERPARGLGRCHWGRDGGRQLCITDLASSVYSIPNLSSDGLRAVFIGSNGTQTGPMYAVRTSIDTKFSGAALIADVPSNVDPFMTDDCGRLYFSAIGSLCSGCSSADAAAISIGCCARCGARPWA